MKNSSYATTPELYLTSGLYEGLYADNPHAMFVMDKSFRFIYVNPAFEQKFGYPFNEVGIDIFPEQVMKHYLKAIYSGNSQRFTAIMPKQDATLMETYQTVVPIKAQGQVIGMYGIVRDASLRKQLEDRLLKAEELYELISNNVKDIIFTCNEEGVFQYVSPSVEEILGYSPEELAGTTFLQYVHPDDPDLPILADPSLKITARAKTKHGAFIWLETVIRRTANKKGESVVLGVSRDVTERIRMEGLLTRSEDQYKTLVETSPQPIIVHTDGRIVYANPSALELLQAGDLDELRDRPILDFIPPEYREAVEARIDNNFETSKMLEEKLIRLDGSVIDVSVLVTAVHYQGKPSRQVLYRDISERKGMEQALRESELKLKQTQQIAGIGGWEYDPVGEVSYWSEELYRLYGLDPRTKITLKEILTLLHPEDREMFLNGLELLKKGIPYDSVFRIIRTDGEERIIRSMRTTILTRQGRYLGVAQDITLQKQIEENLRKSEKLAVLGELAAGIGHEIRNPLTAIKGFVQMIRSRSSEFESYLQVILSEIERINAIASEFMYLAKPQDTRFRPCSIRKIVQEIFPLFESQALLNDVQLFYFDEENLPAILCDENQIKQVLINLVKNAIEAMPNGGRLALRVQRQEAHIRVAVSDTGHGIPRDRLPKLGEPFYSTKAKGNGLGLMVTQRIIDNHQGILRISSEVGIGTTVEVQLPIVAD